MIDIEKHIDNIIEITRSAGKEILSVYHSKFHVILKSDNTPITAADENSNEVLCSGLKELFPSIPIISEETGAIDYDERKDWEYFWLIDPLDGTKEFVKKTDEFCINIALVQGDKPVFGLIYQPVKNISMYNIQSALFKVSGSKREEVKIISNEKNIITVISSSTYVNPQTETMIKSIEEKGYKAEKIIQGSAIKFCLLAEGKADLYPRMGTTMEWDTAAGHALLEASGGKVIDIKTMEPLRYNKISLKNPDFIAASKLVNHLLQEIL